MKRPKKTKPFVVSTPAMISAPKEQPMPLIVDASGAPLVTGSGEAVGFDLPWTSFPEPLDGRRRVFVADDGGNDGTAVDNDEGHAYKTLAAGFARMRNGYPDRLLLKKNNVWTGQQFDLINNIKGPSAKDPMLIGAYSTGDRPLIKPTAASNCAIGNTAVGNSGDFLAIVGIELYDYTRDPSNPAFDSSLVSNAHPLISFSAPITWLLIEDCKLSFAGTNIDINNNGIKVPGGQVRIRRCVDVDAYSTGAFSKGIYIEDIANVLIEGCVIDKNGTNTSYPNPSPTQSRNVYIQYTVDNLVFRRNMSSRSVSEGIQCRHNGVVENNWFLRNPIGLTLGADSVSVTACTPITSLSVKNNVITESCDYQNGDNGGKGITLINLQGPNVHVNGNIVAHADTATGTNEYASTLSHANGPNGEGVYDSDITGNIVFAVENGFSIINDSTGNTITNVEDLAGANTNGYSAPTCSAATFAAANGLTASVDGLLTRMRLMSRDNWSEGLTPLAGVNHVRAGFDQAPV